MDADIVACTKACESCQLVQRNPTSAPLHPWVPASRPGERIHIDYAGPVEVKMLLIVIDSFSKWPKVVIVNSTSEATVIALRTMFSRVGVPQTLVSDKHHNSNRRSSRTSWIGWGCCINLPYHPSLNGIAERFVQTVKQDMKAMASTGSHSRSDWINSSWHIEIIRLVGSTTLSQFIQNPKCRNKLTRVGSAVAHSFMVGAQIKKSSRYTTIAVKPLLAIIRFTDCVNQ